MKSAQRFSLVFVTAPSLKVARDLVRLALKARLVACSNLIPKLESHFWWKGRTERSTEVLILFKTTTARLEKLEKLLLTNHPYDTPEIVSVPLGKGSARYLSWLTVSASDEIEK